jgi:pimeloyl-ACP methyl ester carboxylesterase
LLGPLARQLARHYRVISYQLRGEDDCFVLRRRFGLDDLVDDLAEFLDVQGLECPALFGVSFGGVLALNFAARYPHRLGRLGVQGVGARMENGLLQRVAGIVLPEYPLPSNSPFVNQFFNLLFGKRQEPGPMFEFVTRLCWQTDQSVMAHRFSLLEQFDLANQLERVQTPTLIMAGDRDMLVSEGSLRDLYRGLTDAHLVRMPGCGHLAFVQQPHRVADEFHRFLQN